MFNAEVSKRRLLESLISCGITVSEILASFPQEEASGCPWHHWMISLQACLQVLDQCLVFKSHILCATRSAPSDPGGSVPPRHKATEVWASNFSITSQVRVSSSDETWSPEVPGVAVCIPDSTSIIHTGLQRATCHSDSQSLSLYLNKTCSPLTTEKGLGSWHVFTCIY